MIWLRPLSYEINVDEVSIAITKLLEKEVDKQAKAFGNYELAKSKITMDLKTTLVVRKKNNIVKKLKEKHGEGAKEDDEEEDVPTQAPLALTQGEGEDQGEEEVELEEGVKGEEVSEEPIAIEKKRKDKALVVNN